MATGVLPVTCCSLVYSRDDTCPVWLGRRQYPAASLWLEGSGCDRRCRTAPTRSFCHCRWWRLSWYDLIHRVTCAGGQGRTDGGSRDPRSGDETAGQKRRSTTTWLPMGDATHRGDRRWCEEENRKTAAVGRSGRKMGGPAESWAELNRLFSRPGGFISPKDAQKWEWFGSEKPSLGKGNPAELGATSFLNVPGIPSRCDEKAFLLPFGNQRACRSGVVTGGMPASTRLSLSCWIWRLLKTGADDLPCGAPLWNRPTRPLQAEPGSGLPLWWASWTGRDRSTLMPLLRTASSILWKCRCAGLRQLPRRRSRRQNLCAQYWNSVIRATVMIIWGAQLRFLAWRMENCLSHPKIMLRIYGRKGAYCFLITHY